MHVQQPPCGRILIAGHSIEGRYTSRNVWRPGAEVPDSTAKAAEYKRLYEEIKPPLQTVEDARADPPIGFQPAAPPVAGAGSLHRCKPFIWAQITLTIAATLRQASHNGLLL